MDNELLEQMRLIKDKSSKQEEMAEYSFISSCLQSGFSIQDLKEMEYVDVAKILLCMIPQDKKYRKATAEDWDKLM